MFRLEAEVEGVDAGEIETALNFLGFGVEEAGDTDALVAINQHSFEGGSG